MSQDLADVSRTWSKVSRYSALKLLGAGAAGRVWLSMDRKLGRKVAVKELSRFRDDDRARERFEREARVTAGIRHPNVIAVLDYGIASSGIPFIVYEYLPGGSLPLACPGDPLPPRDEFLRVAYELASGLAAVHAAGILHRDVKPANVLRREGGSPVLADFGLALADREPAALTRTGEIVGTAAYMAPECWLGKAAGPEADQFGLAATLLHYGYGHWCYRSTGIRELVEAARSSAPIEIPTRDDLPEVFRSALRQALSRRPQDRFPRVADLAEHFADALQASGVARRPVSTAATSLPLQGPPRPPVPLATVLVPLALGMAATIGYLTGEGHRPQAHGTLAEVPSPASPTHLPPVPVVVSPLPDPGPPLAPLDRLRLHLSEHEAPKRRKAGHAPARREALLAPTLLPLWELALEETFGQLEFQGRTGPTDPLPPSLYAGVGWIEHVLFDLDELDDETPSSAPIRLRLSLLEASLARRLDRLPRPFAPTHAPSRALALVLDAALGRNSSLGLPFETSIELLEHPQPLARIAGWDLVEAQVDRIQGPPKGSDPTDDDRALEGLAKAIAALGPVPGDRDHNRACRALGHLFTARTRRLDREGLLEPGGIEAFTAMFRSLAVVRCLDFGGVVRRAQKTRVSISRVQDGSEAHRRLSGLAEEILAKLGPVPPTGSGTRGESTDPDGRDPEADPDDER